MRRRQNRLGQFILTLMLILVIFGFGSRIVNAEERDGAGSPETE